MNSAAAQYYPLFSLRFVKAYIITMRPYLMFVSGITVITGMSFANDMSLPKTFFIFLTGFLSYGFGQALTDCYQIDTDSISSPYRPLTRGVVNRNQFILLSLSGLCFVIIILAFFNPVNLFPGILAGFGLYTYTYFKRKWWSGPFYNAWIVAALLLMGYLAGTGGSKLELKNPVFIAALLTVFFGYANFVLTGYFKDIEADRATNYNTLPVIFGRNISSVISDIFGFIASASIFSIFLIQALNHQEFNIIIKPLVFAAAGISAAIYTQINLHKVKTDIDAHKAITPCVHSYILLLSGFAALNKPDWLIPLIIFYLLYLLTIKIRPVKEQI